MKLKIALKTLRDNEIKYKDVFDLMHIETEDFRLKQAIERVKTFLELGY